MNALVPPLPATGREALALAAAGLPVLECGPDKRPLTQRGFKDATIDETLIRALWRKHPDALPAVPTGAASGLFVIDADIDKEAGEALGEASLAALGLTRHDHPHVVTTRSGGAPPPLSLAGRPAGEHRQAAPGSR